ncbi:MAG: phosphoribosylglycinamide formyltransferase [Gammaproteobacteria bacterium]|nr:phosphoribosylglycinamide formyltransferase [Gammaproteobacteria bacterium]
MKQKKLSVVVLISGSGSNLQAILDEMQKYDLPFEIRAVISNHETAYGLDRARIANIPAHTLNHKNFPDRESYSLALQRLIDQFEPGLVVLAGFMRILPETFVNHYMGRVLNIHPSLLPEFNGLHTHQRALKANAIEHGASVHFVTNELDGGPLIIQARIPVNEEDTPETLAARVLEKEHKIYPLAIKWFAQKQLIMKDGQAVLNGKILENPIEYSDSPDHD